MSEFGDRLREARLTRRMSQTELANEMGMQQASISQFESGQRIPTQANIKKLASILKISIEDLAGEDDGKFEEKMLMRNIKGLSPETLRTINDIVDAYRKKEGK